MKEGRTLRSKRTGKGYVPHPHQKEIHDSDKRFRIAICGRRWGKTLCALMELYREMIIGAPLHATWIVPKFKQLRPVSRAIREWIPKRTINQNNTYSLQKTYRHLELTNGSEVWFESAEKPDALRGPGLDLVILEEAAQLRERVWYEIIRPELWDSGGKALIISTPKGRNWLFEEFQKAKHDDNWDYWQRTTYDRLDSIEDEEKRELLKQRIEEDKDTFPRDIFRQEYLAKFLTGAGSVFRNINNCFIGKVDEARFKVIRYSDGMRVVPRQPIEDKQVYIGVDLGRHETFTVFLALDSDGELVGFERFRRLDFPFQKKRLFAFLKYFPRRIGALDARGIGQSFFDDLRREGVHFEGVKLTNPLKRELIHDLVIKLDDEEIHGPKIGSLIEELQAFTYRITKGGNIIYHAPEGCFDDCVIALSFASRNLKHKATGWTSMIGKSYLGE